MPKVDVDAVPKRKGVGYPPPFATLSADRIRQRLGDAGGLSDFGVNLMQLPPGNWSSQRHWHSHEDELVYVLEGEVVLCEDGGEITLKPGDAAAWKAGVANGHCLVNRGNGDATFIEIGTRAATERAHYSDIDMMATRDERGARYTKKDGSPF